MKASEFHFKVENFAIIILAAGNSSRLGSPKQLLTYNGRPLLQLAIDKAKESGPDKVIVVLGSSKQLIESKISNEGIMIVENPDWESGLASSIKSGLRALNNIPTITDAIILMVCDQPFVDAKILKELLSEQAKSGLAIVGSRYEDCIGIPALFHKYMFSELLSLEGDTGAKKLFEKYKKLTSFVSFQHGGIDIDTSEDYKNLTK
ncbi:NTP transferase domain-containing protein [Daejeonella sp.]|uniref:nucleotidyltransferase family protein n=1 Tax=Daejeonella sp. TaxID=2805397 RepID=UPI0039832B14